MALLLYVGKQATEKRTADDLKSPLSLLYSLKYLIIHKHHLDLDHFCGLFLDFPFQIQLIKLPWFPNTRGNAQLPS